MLTESRLLMHVGTALGCLALFIAARMGAPHSASAEAAGDATAVAGVQAATIVDEQQVGPRTISIEVATPSFPSPTVPVEVTLPVGYDADSRRRWPVTYYLAGTGWDQTTFRTQLDGVPLTKDFPSIIVTPKGDAGYWSDWFNDGDFGPPRYETFVTRELIPLIDQHFRTIPQRSQRAVMGESMGGYGAISMAARNPDLFAAAVSISGAVDSNFPTGAAAVSASPLVWMAEPPDAIYGPRATQEIRWRGHNPLDLAGNLRDTAVQIRTGNGVVDPAREQVPTDPASCTLETGIILPESRNMHERLTQLGIEHAWKEYDWGCHSVAMFQQQIRDSLPGILEAFQSERLTSPSLDYRSIAPKFEIWGWQVTTDPERATEFLELHGANRDGLALTGSGDTSIVTPSFYRPNSPVTVVVDGIARRVTADRQGRIAFTVRLGSAHQTQQYAFGADAPMVTKRVQLRR